MNQKQTDLNQVLSSPQADRLLKDKKAMESLMNSGEAQKLMERLNQNAGGGLKDAAQSALNGDAAHLMNLVQGIMNDPKSAKLIEELQKKMK